MGRTWTTSPLSVEAVFADTVVLFRGGLCDDELGGVGMWVSGASFKL